MTTIERFLKPLSELAVMVLIALSVVALATRAIAPVTFGALCAIIALLAGAMVATHRWPGNVFTLIGALFSALVVGRLFSTLHLTMPSAAAAAADPLSIAETGPGIPSITWASVVSVMFLVARLLMLAARDSRSDNGATIEQWGLTALRLYVGLMFIAHFAGHLFGGPAAFKVFVDYFASVGLPAPAAFVILAGLIEVAVTIGLAFGFMTRLAALGAVAYLFVSVDLGGHFGFGYVWVLPNGGWEFPALWIFATGIFLVTGGGPVALDAVLKQRVTLPPGLRWLLS